MFKLNAILGVDFFISVLWISLFASLVFLSFLILRTLRIVSDVQTQQKFWWQLCISGLLSLFLHLPTLASLAWHGMAWETFVK